MQGSTVGAGPVGDNRLGVLERTYAIIDCQFIGGVLHIKPARRSLYPSARDSQTG